MIDFKKPSGPLQLLLYVLLALTVSVFIFFGSSKFGTYGVNKTVGWAFDICSLVLLSVVVSVLIFILGYCILSLFKTRVNRLVSIIHTAIVLLIIYLLLILDVYNNYCTLQVLLSLISVIIFFINMGFAIRYKLIDNKRNN